LVVRCGVTRTRSRTPGYPSRGQPSSAIDSFVPFGGRLCLDLANTVNARLTDAPEDLLTSSADLAGFGLQMGLLSPINADHLAEMLAADPGAAAACIARAVTLRETVFSVFHTLATGTQPDPSWLQDLIGAHASAALETHLVHTPGGASWRWEARLDADPRRLSWLCFPVARSALELLTSAAGLARLKRCAGADRGCGGLFVDDSRNAIRRWCSMDGCGSRAKMRRLYARRRSERSTPA
jgi:predicted RNA-binding Zn ribbon-like protein